MSNDVSDLVNQVMMRNQLDADTLRQRSAETNCNAYVNVSYWELSYNPKSGISLLAFITPTVPGTMISFVRLVMQSPDKSKFYGAAFTSLLQGESPAGAAGVTVSPYVIAPFTPPTPDTQILGTLDGKILLVPSGSCDFYFEKVFEINNGA
jgi:hypothetical protein